MRVAIAIQVIGLMALPKSSSIASDIVAPGSAMLSRIATRVPPTTPKARNPIAANTANTNCNTTCSQPESLSRLTSGASIRPSAVRRNTVTAYL